MRWSNSSDGRSGGGGRLRSPRPRRAATRTVLARLSPRRGAMLLLPMLPLAGRPLLLRPLLQGARCRSTLPASAILPPLRALGALRWARRSALSEQGRGAGRDRSWGGLEERPRRGGMIWQACRLGRPGSELCCCETKRGFKPASGAAGGARAGTVRSSCALLRSLLPLPHPLDAAICCSHSPPPSPHASGLSRLASAAWAAGRLKHEPGGGRPAMPRSATRNCTPVFISNLRSRARAAAQP